MAKATDRPDPKTPLDKTPASAGASSPTESASITSPETPKKVTLEMLAEKVDACVDTSRELIKTIGALVKELQVGKKAGKF